MSGDLISRQAVLDELNKWEWQELYLPIHFKENIIDVVPSVNPQEPKTGHWKSFTHSAYHGVDDDNEPIWREVKVYHCSECNRRTVIKENYCPNCGARMVEPQESKKVNCKSTKCENCINHNYCDYEPQESEE